MVAFAAVFFIIFLSPFFIDLDRFKPEIENQIQIWHQNQERYL